MSTEKPGIKIGANPSKKFFIEMLTKDISLVSCVLDLIDNSIDSVIKKTKFDPMKGFFGKQKNKLSKYKIEINLSKDEFIINDNAEGITEKVVAERAFRFGADVGNDKAKGLSVYGIGMKRALLKIGKEILFKSTSNKSVVSVDIDVDEWSISNDDKGDWFFKGSSIEKNNKKTGTKIKITNLNEQASFNFDKDSFKTELLKKISEVYGIFISNGLVIKVNSKKAESFIPKVAKSKYLKPTIKTLNKDGVKIKIIAGISHENYKKLNGWYVFCNGRMILSGDQTKLTGWGEGGLRKFHSSLNRFVGYVYFESDDVISLPWATTKDGVDYDSTLYQFTLNEMIKIAHPIVSFLASQYNTDTKMEIFRKMVEEANEVSLNDLNIRDQSFVAPIPKIKEMSEKNTRILYEVPKKDLEKVKKIMGGGYITNSAIGKKTFYDYIKYNR